MGSHTSRKSYYLICWIAEEREDSNNAEYNTAATRSDSNNASTTAGALLAVSVTQTELREKGCGVVGVLSTRAERSGKACQSIEITSPFH